jgi:RNA polymerase sigma factor (sigma-70 family)
MPESTDVPSLLERARTDAASLHELIELFRTPLLCYVRTILGPETRRHAESVDFVQDVVVEALRDYPRSRIEHRGAFLRWLMAIANNNVRDAHRKKRAQLVAEWSSQFAGVRASGPGVASAAGADEAVAELVLALAELPEIDQRVIRLREFDQLSFAQIGGELGCSENAAQIRHARALVRLGESLRKRRPN